MGEWVLSCRGCGRVASVILICVVKLISVTSFGGFCNNCKNKKLLGLVPVTLHQLQVVEYSFLTSWAWQLQLSVGILFELKVPAMVHCFLQTMTFTHLKDALTIDWTAEGMAKKAKKTPDTYFITRGSRRFLFTS